MAKVTALANPFPPSIGIITDPDTLTGEDTNRPFPFSFDEMVYYYWSVKSLITSDGNVCGGNPYSTPPGQVYNSETDLLCNPVIFEYQGGDEILTFALNLNSVYLDELNQYWPYIRAFYHAYNGVYYSIGMASEGFPPNASDTWPYPILRGTVTIFDKGSVNLWLAMPDGLYPEYCPFSDSGSVSINDYWSYS
jgi:hypothetical protein